MQRSTRTARPTWAYALPRLGALFNRGLLVPFTGAGVSRPTCGSWTDLICGLESAAGIAPAGGDRPDDLIRRANAAVRRLRHQGRLAEAVAAALTGGVEHAPLPPGAGALAEIPWPLVITTNYDNLYRTAAASRWGRAPQVLGRSAVDCFLVGRALREPVGPVLWAIQGFLDHPLALPDGAPRAALVDELVIGHEEYRRVTHAELHFRRAFAEVYRSRSLLFVGSGLGEHYLLELFSEVREVYGPNSHLHYALAPEGQLDVEFLGEQYQIAVLEYPVVDGDHRTVWERLRELAGHVVRGKHSAASAPAQTHWVWHVPPSGELAVSTSPLTATLACDDACIAVSAGAGARGELLLSSSITALVDAVAPGVKPVCTAGVVRWPHRPLFAVQARAQGDERSLASIYWSTRSLLEAAEVGGYRTIHAQLLASGPGLQRQGEGAEPPFRPVNALGEMASAYGDHVRSRGEGRAPVRLVVHVVDPEVYSELRCGRLDLLEYLAYDVRFWVTIEAHGRRPEYHVIHEPAPSFGVPPGLSRGGVAERTLREVAHHYGVPDDWTVEVWPSPDGEARVQRVGDERQEVPYRVVTGSIVRFKQP